MTPDSERTLTLPASDYPAPSPRGSYLPARIDQETLEAILCDVATGVATHKALAAQGINRRTFYWTLATDEQAANSYMRAKQLGCRAYADDTEEIQDETPPTVPTKYGEATDAAWVSWQRNRVELRKWHLTKLMPSVYGDKMTVDGAGLITINISPQDDKLL